ncbi:Hypothetical predicted protein [Mytilus galloprovincialis]|uniref:H-type lectin domain-containing protein n=1 Tax=Mytilus galloprovincialis TaxID=29158 RepID=A0A8B6FPI5_MYTGA|nr:Hypothetical predicted protein [Mytilus galloprovincialis]
MKLVFIFITVCIVSAFGGSVEFESSPSVVDDIKNEVEAPKSAETKLKSKDDLETEFQALKSEVSDLETEVRHRHYRRHGCISGTAQLGYSSRRNKHRIMYIPFRRPFRRTPALVVGMTSLDTYRGKNVRIKATVSHLSGHGFMFKIVSWGGSITYEVVYSWMACPK